MASDLWSVPAIQEWVGGLVSVPAMVTDEGAPFEPTVMIWVETSTELVVGLELCHPDEALAKAAATLLEITRAPKAGPPRVPARVRVASTELADALRGAVGSIDVVFGPTPELEPVIESLREYAIGERTWLRGDVSADQVAYFFAVSAELYQRAPWRIVPAAQFLAVQCEALDIEHGALCVVGQQGQAFGMALFRTDEDAMDHMDMLAASKGRRPDVIVPHIMVDFSADCSPSIAREIAEHGWPTAGPGAIPSAVMVSSNFTSSPLTRSELAAVTAIMRALATMIAEEPELRQAWSVPGHEIMRRMVIGGPTGDIEVTLAAPLPMFEDDDELDLDDEDPEYTALTAAADAYLDQLAADEALAPDLLDWAELITQYAVNHHGALVHELEPEELQELLFKTIPHGVTCEPTDAPSLIAAVEGMLAHVAAQPGGEPIRRLLAAIPRDAAQRLAGLLADPRNFGLAKQFVIAGTAAGFDMTSEEGVAAFLEATEARGPARRSRPSARPPTRHKPRTTAKKAKPKAKTKTKTKTNAKAKTKAKPKPKSKPKRARRS